MGTFKIKFTDGNTSLGYKIRGAIIGRGHMLLNEDLCSIEDYLSGTGNCTHIALLNDKEKLRKLYPIEQVLCIEA